MPHVAQYVRRTLWCSAYIYLYHATKARGLEEWYLFYALAHAGREHIERGISRWIAFDWLDNKRKHTLTALSLSLPSAYPNILLSLACWSPILLLMLLCLLDRNKSELARARKRERDAAGWKGEVWKWCAYMCGEKERMKERRREAFFLEFFKAERLIWSSCFCATEKKKLRIPMVD